MVAFADIVDSRPAALDGAAQGWTALAHRLKELEDRAVTEVTRPLRQSGWKGDAADEALFQTEAVDDQYELDATQTNNLALLLHKAHEDIDRLQRNLRAVIDGAALLGLAVHHTGTVRMGPELESLSGVPASAAQERYALGAQNLRIYQDLIRDLVARGIDLDERYAEAIRRFLPGPTRMRPTDWADATDDARATADLYGLRADTIPKPGSDPTTVAAWWNGLTPEQRQLYATAYPQQIGALDGIPTTVRDDANRQELRIYIGDNWNHGRDYNNPHHDRAVQLLGRIEAGESAPPGRELYLLDIDPVGDGRAAVAVGNPDTAAHTAILVAGVGTELGDMKGQIGRAERLQAAAAGADNGNVAVVAWLGYDPPALDTDIVTAPFGVRSEDGAENLDRFVNGLRTTHDGPPSHMTAIGHSYGSTVVGHAASHGDGLAVDDVVAVGSPGMRVEHAEDFNVDPRHVWAGSAGGDPIADPPARLGDGVHGPPPHASAFGGNRFHVDTHGHSGYWDEDSESLRNQGRIIAGDYGLVGLDHGRTPA